MSNSHVTHEELREARKEILEAIAETREDITDRLDNLNGSIARAHDRITRTEVIISGHQSEITRLRDKWHGAVDEIVKRVRASCAAICEARGLDTGPVNMNTLKLLVGLVITTVLLTTAVILWVQNAVHTP